MFSHHITARLVENRVEVATPGRCYSVFRHDDAKENGACPMDYLAGALGS